MTARARPAGARIGGARSVDALIVGAAAKPVVTSRFPSAGRERPAEQGG